MSRTIEVIAKPEPIITGDLFVCPGANATISLTDTYSVYDWKNEDGMTLSSSATVALEAGAYEIYGCQ